jgi:predicted MFS family arabinose efflux permease
MLRHARNRGDDLPPSDPTSSSNPEPASLAAADSQSEQETPPTSTNTKRSVGGFAEAVETFRLPFYGRLWASNLVQFICLHVLFLAMHWLVSSMSDLRSAVGIIAFIQGGTIALASPFAGVIVDRRSKRGLIIFGRLGLACVASSLGILVWSGSIAYWHLIVVSVVGGLVASVLSPATQTFVVDVVGRNRTEHAISLNAIGASFGTIGGAALAGVLIGAVGVVSTFLSAAVGVALSGLLVLTIPVEGQSGRAKETSPFKDLMDGFAYVRARPPLLLALLACGMALFNGAIGPMRVIFARHVLEVGAESYGMMSGVHGLGTMLAALYVTLRPPTKNFGLLITGTMLLYAIGILLYSFAFSFGWILAVEGFLGFAGQLWHISALIGFQLVVPEEMRGRVLSMVFTLAQLGFVGGLLVSILADVAGDQLAVAVFGAIPTVLLGSLLLFGWKTLKKM